MRKLGSACVLSLAALLAACGGEAVQEAGQGPAAGGQVSAPPVEEASPAPAPEAAADAAVAALNGSFDPARDPGMDLETAKGAALRDGKRIILDVGGEWCSWCHILDKFIEADTEIRGFRDANFVWMKVNYSEENDNQAFLSRYPQIKGYPHLFVLDADGKLLHSQFTGDLEQGRGYDRGKFIGFLQAWAPTGEK